MGNQIEYKRFIRQKILTFEQKRDFIVTHLKHHVMNMIFPPKTCLGNVKIRTPHRSIYKDFKYN